MEDEEHEESYKRLRGERRQIFLHDYPELYSATTEHGDLILQERSQIVHWIIEVSFIVNRRSAAILRQFAVFFFIIIIEGSFFIVNRRSA